MKDEQTTTIGQILEMQPGTRDNPAWVNGSFRALLINPQVKYTKSGTPYVACLLKDEGGSISASFFGHKACPPNGSLVQIGGTGLSLGEYNGNPQLSGSAKTTINLVADGPQSRSNAVSRPSAAPNGSGQAPCSHGTPLGVTVGMALNNAAQDMRADSDFPLADDELTKQFLWRRASLYLRLSQAFEAGKIAPLPRGAPLAQEAPVSQPVREELAPPPPPAREAPRTAAARADDEDVPF